MSVGRLVALLRERVGLDPASVGERSIAAARATRMRALGMTDTAAYASRAAAESAELDALVDGVVVPESWFFRGGTLFAHLAEWIGQATHSTPFRVLSVPCAGGQEPYSLAIALAERGLPPTACTIEGVDLSLRVLSQARAGVFGDFSFRELDPALKQRYFQPVAGGWEIVPTLRERVRFHLGNLAAAEFLAGEPPFDLIVCRNLLIYFHAAARRQALDHLDRLLAPRGWLCAGHAESIAQLDTRFVHTGPPGMFLYHRAGAETSTPEPQPRVLPKPRPSVPSPLPLLPPSLSPPPAVPPVSVPRPDVLALARAAADSGRLDEALQLCGDHLGSVGPSAAGYCLLGEIRQARHEEAEADTAFQKALYLDPDNQDALLHLSLLSRRRGDDAQAERLRRRLDRVRRGDA